MEDRLDESAGSESISAQDHSSHQLDPSGSAEMTAPIDAPPAGAAIGARCSTLFFPMSVSF